MNVNNPLLVRRFGRLAVVIALILVVCATVGYIGFRTVFPADFSGDEKSAAIASLRRQMPEIVEVKLRGLRQEVRFPENLRPTLVYEGKTATVFHTGVVEGGDYERFGVLPTYRVLARTPAGRYFTVKYFLDPQNVRACSEQPTSCIFLADFYPLSAKEDAMDMVFRDKQFTPERFRTIFGVEPPAPAASMPA